MNYKFPEIRHINDVLPAIEGRNEFIVAEREWGMVINYVVSTPDTFPVVQEILTSGKLTKDLYDKKYLGKYNLDAAIRRECRGLLFYPDGGIMARRLHKFFNINEKDETQFHNIDFTQPHVILEKLDGSMITPVITDSGIRWGTKMGLTEVGMGAEEFVANHPQYVEFADLYLERGKTPIFEWCSRKQRIVIDYPEDRLVLIAIRNNVTGEYASYQQLQTYASAYDIDVVKAYEGTAENMKALISETSESEGIEGWIIRFDDGHMLKVKGEWYLRIHKNKDILAFEKNLIELIINENLDDAKAFMLEDDRTRVEKFEKAFWSGFEQFSHQLFVDLEECRRDVKGDRKQFALNLASRMPMIERSAMFACWDGKCTVREHLMDVIKKNCNTQAKVDSVRHLWGSVKWNYQTIND